MKPFDWCPDPVLTTFGSTVQEKWDYGWPFVGYSSLWVGSGMMCKQGAASLASFLLVVVVCWSLAGHGHQDVRPGCPLVLRAV